MMIVILVCEPSNFYAVFMKDDLIMKNTVAQGFLCLFLQLVPPTVFLFIKKTEDCFACFNRYSTRYSSYQYSNPMVAVQGIGFVETTKNLNDSRYKSYGSLVDQTDDSMGLSKRKLYDELGERETE